MGLRPAFIRKGNDTNAMASSSQYEVGQQARIDIPTQAWYKNPGLRKLYLMMPILFMGSTVNGYDGSLLNGLQTSDSWQTYFGSPTGSKLGLFTAIQNVGAVCALPFSSYAADIFGRRWGVAIGIFFIFIGVIVQAVPSTTEGMFIGGRFLVGFGSNISQGSAPLLIIELAHPNQRGTVTTMYNTLWYVGSIIAAWTVFGTLSYAGDASWRIPVALQVLMPAIQFCVVWLLPESPRWLCSKDRGDEALAVLVKYHANGDASDSFVRSEFIEIQETIALEKANKSNGWTVFIWSFLVAIGFSFLVDKLGRKKLFMIAAVGMLLSFSVWTGCSAVYAQSGNSSAGSAVIAMVFLFYLAAGFAWPGLTVAYVSEILPYNIRAKGLAIGFAITSSSSVVNQYVNPIGLKDITWKFYFVYIVILIIECLCIWFLFVETKGPTLEEIARLFDGDDAAVAHESMVANRLQEKDAAIDSTHVELV
ncbi:hypothetical protein LTR08_002884 [Meristemomyces frigidus]|nr:hypothetical protein LTR08_002884 [Meristemomyces frigidus]